MSKQKAGSVDSRYTVYINEDLTTDLDIINKEWMKWFKLLIDTENNKKHTGIS